MYTHVCIYIHVYYNYTQKSFKTPFMGTNVFLFVELFLFASVSVLSSCFILRNIAVLIKASVMLLSHCDCDQVGPITTELVGDEIRDVCILAPVCVRRLAVRLTGDQ